MDWFWKIRGNWVPLIPLGFRWPILLLWMLEPIARGLDYVTGENPETSHSLTFVESAMPLQVWGCLFLTGGIFTAIGFGMLWPRMAILGLHIAGTTYASMSLGLAVETLKLDGDGFRTPVMFAVFAATFWLAAFGYWHQWRVDRETNKLTAELMRARGLPEDS